MWQALRRRQILGLKFRCQHPIGRWIVDFYCPALRLAVEVDGSSHHGRERQDAYRDRQLARHRVRVMRIRAYRVFHELELVLREVVDFATRAELAQTASRVPRQAGYRRQPQKNVPALAPRLASRRTIAPPHRGQVGAELSPPRVDEAAAQAGSLRTPAISR